MPQPTIVFGMNTLFAVRQFLPEILAMVQERGLRPVVICPEPGDIPGVEFRCVPMQREISVFSDVLALVRVFLVLRSVRPSVVNMSTPKMALIGGLAAWMARVPHRIYTLRGLRFETARGARRQLLIACERVAAACAHRVICISRSVRDTVVRDRIVPEAKATVLGERVSEGISLRPGAPARTLDIPKSAKVIGFVGRLTRDKGIRDLVEAFRLLLAGGLDVYLLLLGEFEQGDPVDPETVHFIRTDPHVRWLGYVPDPSAYYPSMDVFVFPTHREGLGRVLLEAAAAGKPVVSTRTTGVVDVVVDGVTGLLVPLRDPHALARATEALLKDPDLATRMGHNARRMVDEQFDNAIYLQRLGVVLDFANGANVRAISSDGDLRCTPWRS